MGAKGAMQPRRDRSVAKGSVKTVQKLPPGVSQPVPLQAALGLAWDGHLDQPSIDGGDQVLPAEVLAVTEREDALQVGPTHLSLACPHDGPDLRGDLWGDPVLCPRLRAETDGSSPLSVARGVCGAAAV